MTYLFIEPGGAEFEGGIFPAQQVQPHLAQPEQIEVVDQKRDEHQQNPSEGVQRMDGGSKSFILDMPDNSAHRLPLPEQQKQAERRQQTVCAALRCLRDKAGQQVLKSLPRHDCVLYPKQSDQPDVDQKGLC